MDSHSSGRGWPCHYPICVSFRAIFSSTAVEIEFDFQNRLIGVSSPTSTTSYAFDGDGNSVSKTDVSGIINYINDVNLPLVQVLMEEDEVGNVLASYTIGNDLVSRHSPATEQTSYYHYDGLGSTRQLSDSTGTVTADYVYDAWGNVLSSTDESGNVYGFTGEQQFGETDGLVFLRARYYDPKIGRFISKDPFWGFVNTPQTLNLYIYCINNPINWIDPWGLAVERTYSGTGPSGKPCQFSVDVLKYKHKWEKTTKLGEWEYYATIPIPMPKGRGSPATCTIYMRLDEGIASYQMRETHTAFDCECPEDNGYSFPREYRREEEAYQIVFRTECEPIVGRKPRKK